MPSTLLSSSLESSVEAQRAAADNDRRDRKLEHIELSLDRRIQLDSRFFDQWGFVHNGLPDLDKDEIDTGVDFLGKRLKAPLLISCMTGGTGDAARINRNLAEAAERAGIALGVGSQRKAIESPDTAGTFEVREAAPTVPVLGNLGAVQLNYGFGIEECRQAVSMVGADALALHLNPLQEALQPEGQCNFKGLVAKVGFAAAELDVPVVVKEIGCGLSEATGRALYEVGIRHFDAAGLGGTSWARIEAARAADVPLGELFAHWGVPTPESIRGLRRLGDDVSVIGSGGVRSGLDVAKALALGADLVGLAQPFLGPALESADAVYDKIQRIVEELRIAMFCTASQDVSALQKQPLKQRLIPRAVG